MQISTLSGKGGFTIEEGASVIVRDKGLYSQVHLYCRGPARMLFCEYKKGVAKMNVDGSTSIMSLNWDEIIGVDTEPFGTGLRIAK